MNFKGKGPTYTALAWLIFTASLVIWWWIFGVQTAADDRVYRMMLWEGGFLVMFILVGGSALVFYTNSHAQRHKRLKFFFSTFAHDLKTSMTRLRLQAEMLQEDLSGHSNAQALEKLMENIQRLDLQLENSLWMASLDDRMLLTEDFKLSEVLASLRAENPDLKIDLQQDAKIRADKRALQIVIRNIFQNSIIHGEANTVSVASSQNGQQLKIEFTDNGKGLSQQISHLGREPLKSQNSQTNGIGLYLSAQLLQRMNGRYEYQTAPKFTNIILINGVSLESR